MIISVTLIINNNNLTFCEFVTVCARGFEIQVQRYVNNAESKKSKKVNRNENKAEEANTSIDGHNSSGYTSEEQNMCEENSGGASAASKSTVSLNSNGKKRASRGSATDPQSLYARVIINFFISTNAFCLTIPLFNLHSVNHSMWPSFLVWKDGLTHTGPLMA